MGIHPTAAAVMVFVSDVVAGKCYRRGRHWRYGTFAPYACSIQKYIAGAQYLLPMLPVSLSVCLSLSHGTHTQNVAIALNKFTITSFYIFFSRRGMPGMYGM